MTNPFRRPSSVSGQAANSSHKSPLFDQTHSTDALIANKNKAKAVSLSSPPPLLSVSRDRGLGFGRNDAFGSTSPDITDHHPESVHNIFQKADSGREEDTAFPSTGESSRRNTNSSVIVPSNPFDKGSAANSHTPVFPSRGLENVQPDIAKDNRRISRALDVDSFKNLLLTGTPTPSRAVAESSQHRSSDHTLPDGGSSTDASSISRQSNFEAFQGSLQDNSSDSRRSSNDLSVQDNERLKSQSTTDHKTVKMKPPPPRHRHGKTLAPKGPQIVSFDDFIPTGFDQGTPPSSRAAIQDNPPRDGKLPSPSSPSTNYNPTKALEGSSKASITQQVGSTSQDLAASRKSAPPPPLTRRSTISKRSRSDTTSSIASQAEEPSAFRTPAMADSMSKSAPPPPPARRMGSTGNSAATPQQISPNDSHDTSSMAYKSYLPPSMRNRSSSQASSVSTVNTGPTSPPPRPPPRRMSSRGSMDLGRTAPGSIPTPSRTSAELRRPSLENEQDGSHWPFPPDGIIAEESDNDSGHNHQARGERSQSSAADILADMEAFQREVDELRARSLRLEG